MPITYQLDSRYGMIVTTCAGQVMLREVLAHFLQLETEPVLPKRLDVLLDLTQTTSLPTSDQVREVAAAVERLRSKISWGDLVVVANRDAMFGMSRVFEALTAEYFEAATVCRERAEAELWLAARRAQRS